MKYEGTSRLKSGVVRYKFVCPKMRWIYNSATKKAHRQCFCENPCTTSSCGRMVYLYPEKDLRTYPGALRGTTNGTRTIRSGQPLNDPSTTSRILSVLQEGKRKMKRQSTRICFWPELRSFLACFLLIRYININTSAA